MPISSSTFTGSVTRRATLVATVGVAIGGGIFALGAGSSATASETPEAARASAVAATFGRAAGAPAAALERAKAIGSDTGGRVSNPAGVRTVLDTPESRGFFSRGDSNTCISLSEKLGTGTACQANEEISGGDVAMWTSLGYGDHTTVLVVAPDDVVAVSTPDTKAVTVGKNGAAYLDLKGGPPAALILQRADGTSNTMKLQ